MLTCSDSVFILQINFKDQSFFITMLPFGAAYIYDKHVCSIHVQSHIFSSVTCINRDKTAHSSL